MNKELDARLYVDHESPWQIIDGAIHQYSYPGGSKATLASYRRGKFKGSLGQEIQFPETYFVREIIPRTGPIPTHGNHWHTTKIEHMSVISGAWEFTLESPTDPEKKIVLTICENDNRTILIKPGVRHTVKPAGERGTRCILYVMSSTEFDAENDDTHTRWPY